MNLTLSQEKISIRNLHKERLINNEIEHRQTGKNSTYGYGSLAIKEEYERISKNKAPFFDIEFELNPFKYQYDLELFIFLHYNKLADREIILSSGSRASKVREYGFTGFERHEHLLNAIAIRWPTKTDPSGRKVGSCVRTPWLEDVCFSFSNYDNTIVFGGAGQGKTFGMIVFMSMIFDYFYYTKSGAQCTYSSVNEHKLQTAPWSFVNSLYPVDKERPAFSSSVGMGKKSAEYTYKRVGLDNKIIETGGNFKGVLLAQGVKDARVVDKLTGCHDPVARCYLLDEMQSTSDAPINAHPNMFMHPKYGWFCGSGNYELPSDLLGVNVVPNIGWSGVNERTHMYEGTLKSTVESLGKLTNVIHFNNDLSPAILNPELANVYTHLPNAFKRDKNYPTEESKKTIAYKRFWIGWRYEKEDSGKEYILTNKLLVDSKACEMPDFQGKPFPIFSFDSAPASVDRNINTVFDVGISKSTNKIIIAPRRIYAYEKPDSEFTYYQETSDRIIETAQLNQISSGNGIMDWTNRTALIEKLYDRGFICHHLIYNEAIPKRVGINKVTKEAEDLIQLETIKTFIGRVEKKVTYYAHEKVQSRIALGAYLMRYFIEEGCVRGINSSILSTVPENHGFEDEFLRRTFTQTAKGLLTIDSKDKFKETYKFSPDVLDTFFQAFYLLYVILKIHPKKNNMGLLKKDDKKELDRIKKPVSILGKVRF